MSKPATQSRKEARQCRCPRGHAFSFDVAIRVNTAAEPDFLQRIDGDGGQPVSCPVCRQQWHLLEPVVIHDPAGDRSALFVPPALTHRTLHCLATLAAEVAADQSGFPRCFSGPAVLTGRDALVDWWPKYLDEPAADASSIQRAFADLSSIVPPPPDREK